MTHDSAILKGIPRGVWADLWATEQEEKGRSFGGQELTSIAPPTPAWAKKWAKGVADEIVRLNADLLKKISQENFFRLGVKPGKSSLDSLYELVKRFGYPYDREHFGYHLGMQAAGHGVSWSDDTRRLRHETIKLPYREFYR